MLSAIPQQVQIVLIPLFNIHLFESVNYYYFIVFQVSRIWTPIKLETPSQRNAP